ncbi:MAG TPA: PTS sugar transporter subunit IIC [bacterium]|nr:PTS sugar transporter subunit IIC [bacterium]HQG47075.1 PTS sugar transporter subunit IIC [bacterium]HQI47381.1 PTS sugar transporter subunit IIC [bacterium]HQJ63017.1 PTS sugar transporter subunit IIC [bacterium]
MWQDLAVVSVWGGVVALDTTAALQILISRPLVACSVAGFLLGGFPAGFLIGLIFELLYLDELPVGGAFFNEGNVGATIAAGLAVLLDRTTGRPELALFLAALTGLAMSKAGGQIVELMRRVNTRIYARLMALKQITPGAVTRHHLFAILCMFIAGGLLTFAALAGFGYLFQRAAPLIPVSLDRHMQSILYVFLGTGCAVLLHHFYSRRNWWHLAAGAGLGLMLWVLLAAQGGGGR